MKISVLGSGSSGNATLIATEKTCVLIDLGFGPRSLARRLNEAGLGGKRIDAVLVTHGHSDHISGIPAFVASQPVPVFMNEGTRQESPDLEQVERWEVFQPGETFIIGDLTVEAFSTPHDAAQPVGFRVSAEGLHGAITTDLGILTPQITSKLTDCDFLVLESNHDELMLKTGSYPWLLKQRVLGRNGHLSNRALAEFLQHEFDGKSRHLLLAHLSQHNNHPDIAFESASKALLSRSCSLFESCQVHLTQQGKPSIVLSL